MNINYGFIGSLFLGACGIVISIISAAYTRKSNKHIKQTCSNLDLAYEDMRKQPMTINITEKMLTDVANEKIGKEIDYRLPSVIDKAIEKGEQRINNSVSDELDKHFDDCEKIVLDRVREGADRRDIDGDIERIERDYIRQCKESVDRRFDDEFRKVSIDMRNQVDRRVRELSEEMASKYTTSLSGQAAIISTIDKMFQKRV